MTRVWLLSVAVAVTGCNAILDLDRYRACVDTECADATDDGSDGADALIDAPVDAPAEATCNPDADLSGDSLNCGRCGHSCLGASCANGLCTPTVLIDNMTGVAFAHVLLVDDQNVYVTSNKDLRYCPIAGCIKTSILFTQSALPSLAAVALSGTQFFLTSWAYADGGSGYVGDVAMIDRANIGQPTTHLANSPNQADTIITCGGSVCWMDRNGSTSTTIYSCGASPPCNNPKQIIQFPGILNGPLAFDGANVYFSDGLEIYSAPKSGATTATTMVTAANVTSMVFTNGKLYWWESGLSNNPAIKFCTPPSCTTSTNTLVSPGPPNTIGPRLTFDATHLYWSEDSMTNGAIKRCALGGCGNAPETLASQQPWPGAIAVDATRVYWLNLQQSVSTGAVLWVAK